VVVVVIKNRARKAFVKKLVYFRMGFEAFQPNVGVSEFWTPRARPDFKSGFRDGFHGVVWSAALALHSPA
jgi:hypothetical protein